MNKEFCSYCKGYGCNDCNGTGYKVYNCQFCMGTGVIGNSSCPYCNLFAPIFYDTPSAPKSKSLDNLVQGILADWSSVDGSMFLSKAKQTSKEEYEDSEEEEPKENTMKSSRSLISEYNELLLQIPETRMSGFCSYCNAKELSIYEFKTILVDKDYNRTYTRWLCDGCFRKFSSGIMRISPNKKYGTYKVNNMGEKDNVIVMESWNPDKEGWCSYCPRRIIKSEFKLILNFGIEWNNKTTDDRWLCRNCFSIFQTNVLEMYYENMLGLLSSELPIKKETYEEPEKKEIPNFSIEEVSKFRKENFEISFLLNDDECRIKMANK